MKRYLHRIFGLHAHRSIWIEEEELGKETEIVFKRKRYAVKIPAHIHRKIVLRLKGLGRTRGYQTGDLLLHVWLNKGADIRENLWLSETFARNGGYKTMSLGYRKIIVKIPPNSRDGMTIRLRGLGEEMDTNWRTPFLRRRHGNLLMRLFVYPDSITPRYGSFDLLSTEDMALESWVYQKIDELINKMGRSYFPANPLGAEVVADRYNESGWRGIFPALVGHLKLAQQPIFLDASASSVAPGICKQTVTVHNNIPTTSSYVITLNEQFLDNPFAVAAILAHELCHVIYSAKLSDPPMAVGNILISDKDSLEQERTVDLLAFMFKIGEFQLRMARDKRLTLGYFHQDVFERMQVIVAKKLGSAQGK